MGLAERSFLQEEEARPGYRQAMDRALTLLGRRGYSRAEIEQRLSADGFPETAVARVSARLQELELVDDRTLAREWAEQVADRGLGDSEIRRRLHRRGLEEAAVDAALSTLPPEVDRALEAATPKMARLQGQPPASAYRRLGAYLARRGFDAEVVEAVCDRLCGRFFDKSPDIPD